jgi:uncharacterized protein
VLSWAGEHDDDNDRVSRACDRHFARARGGTAPARRSPRLRLEPDPQLRGDQQKRIQGYPPCPFRWRFRSFGRAVGRKAGIRRLSLFGSVARGDADVESDIDLAVEFDPAAEMDLIRMVALERRIGETLGRSVEIVPEPVENARLRANLERDRRIAF